jgi:hypothetical protein
MRKIAVPGGDSKSLLPYHKRYQQDMIADAVGLDLRVVGAMTMLRDLMFHHGGGYPDDRFQVSRALGIDIRSWPPLRNALLSSGRVYEADGSLRSSYVDKILGEQRRYLAAQQIRGHKSASAQHRRRMDAASHQQACNEKSEKPLKTLNLDSTVVEPIQNPESRYKEGKSAPPSPPFESGAVVAEGVGEQSEPVIVVSNLLARHLQNKGWRQ